MIDEIIKAGIAGIITIIWYHIGYNKGFKEGKNERFTE